MKNCPKANKVTSGFLAITAIILAIFANLVSADQVTSTISPSGEHYIAFQDNNGTMTFTTTEQPEPDCSSDVANGDPDYFWEFGVLDGIDNGDGTLDVKTDVEGNESIKVFCSQEYFDREDNPYTAQTLTSD